MCDTRKDKLFEIKFAQVKNTTYLCRKQFAIALKRSEYRQTHRGANVL